MAETINDTVLRLQTFIQNLNPQADIAPGTVINELIVKLGAAAQNPIIDDTAALNQGNSVAAVIASATDTANPIIDGVASNYNTSRGTGKASTGYIKVVVKTNTGLYLQSGFTFIQPVLQLNYVTTTQLHITPNPTLPTDIPLVVDPSGFAFVIPVVASTVGSQYQVSANTQFALTTQNISGFISAYAYGNFTSGLPSDTDKVLISNFQTGLSNKTLLSPTSISSRLSQLFPNVVDTSVIGVNDEEMTRCKQNILGISTLGTADVYIRSSIGPETIKITKTATQTDGVWSFSLDYTDVPGFYRVISVLPTGQNLTGTFVTTQTYNYSTAGIVPANLVNNVQEARFTKYQTATITFTYASALSTADFDVLLSYQPNIGDIQDLFLTSSERISCADYLIKAALPCFVTVGLKVHKNNPNSTLPVDLMKQDIFNYINTIKFGNSLYISKLVEICHNYDIQFVEFPVVVNGNIYANDGSVVQVASTDTLQIPTNLSIGISRKTTLFFADYFRSGASNLQNLNSMSESISIEVL